MLVQSDAHAAASQERDQCRPAQADKDSSLETGTSHLRRTVSIAWARNGQDNGQR